MNFLQFFVRVCVLLGLIFARQCSCVSELSDYSLRLTKVEVAPHKQPMLVIDEKGSFDFAKPILRENIMQIFLTGKRHLVLVCPKTPEISKNLDSKTAEKSKYKSSRLVVDKQRDLTWQWSNVKCDDEFEVEVIRTEDSCAETGLLYEIGFYAESKGSGKWMRKIKRLLKSKATPNKQNYDWYKLITICYDEKDASPIYSSHTLFAISFEIKFRLSVRPNLVDYVRPFQPFAGEPNLATYYSKENQYENFVNIFGGKIADIYWDGKLKYIKEAQLTPAEDFLYLAFQSAAFSYLNVFPGWSALVERNWRKAENIVRNFSYKNEYDLTVVTGTWGWLQLKNESGELRKVHLDSANERIKLADILWKLVYEPSTGKAIAFILHHNPYQDSCESKICDDICSNYGWSEVSSNNLDGGCTYCCDVRKVRFRITNIPSVEVTDILKY